MEDIAPDLLKKIRNSFLRNIKENPRASALLQKIEAGTAGYAQADDYAYEIGNALSDAFMENLSSASLPDGRMHQNIAEKVIAPLLREDHDMINKAAALVQKALNEAAGIGLKAQNAPVDAERIDGIVHRVSNETTFDDISWILVEPVKTFSQSIVDEVLKINVEFQGKLGLQPRIIRRAESKCCEWCSGLAGSYDYPDVPKDVYRRHERCRCVVEYDPATGKRRQNVWSKQWTATQKDTKMEGRQLIG